MLTFLSLHAAPFDFLEASACLLKGVHPSGLIAKDLLYVYLCFYPRVF